MQTKILAMLWLVMWAVAAAQPTAWAQSANDQAPQAHPMLSQAIELAKQQDYERALQMVRVAEQQGAEVADVLEAKQTIESKKALHLSELEATLETLLDQQAIDEARAVLIQWVALGAEQRAIERYRTRIENIQRYGAYQPGQVIRDRYTTGEGFGPELVVIPKGQFMMGSSDGEANRASHEGPRHRVVMDTGFAVGRYEVSVGQFREFVEATGHRTDAERRGRGRVYDPKTRRITDQSGMHWRLDYRGQAASDDLPVIHVSWRDAKAYVAWLSGRTNQPYRLLSEAEFEYVLRAGSQWMYPWGASAPQTVIENLAGDGDRSPSGASWSVAFPSYSDGHWGPAPVGQFEANAMGVFDMAGNVMEWVEDCWHDSYVRAPADGSPWVNRGCGQHVVRGGSWAATPALARSAFRMAMAEQQSDVRVGFRVARDLGL